MSLYPKLIGVYGHKSGHKLVDAIKEFSGTLRSSLSLRLEDIVPNGQVALMVPVNAESIRPLTAYKYKIERLIIDGTRCELAVFVTDRHSLNDLIEKLRPFIVGPYETLIKKRLAEYRLRLLNEDEDNDDDDVDVDDLDD
jgi:hypothetical protein